MDWVNLVLLFVQLLKQAPQLAGLIEQIWTILAGHPPTVGHAVSTAGGPSVAQRQQMADAIAAAQKTALQP